MKRLLLWVVIAGAVIVVIDQAVARSRRSY